jgi:hypothetical protein
MKQIKPVQVLFFMFTLVVFIVGGYVYSTMDIRKRLENMETHKEALFQREGFAGCLLPQNKIEGLTAERPAAQPPTPENPAKEESCPDMLIKVGSELHLYNNSHKTKTGENPIVFKTMDEYIQHLEIQRKNGIKCPVLFLQKENDAQGKDVYRVRPSPFNTGAGLPITSNLNMGVNQKPIVAKDASRDSKYNTGQYAGFDPYGLYVGRITNIDEVGMSTEQPKVSDNPMDANWGGVLHTQKAVDSGKYDENTVTRVIYPTPKTNFIPIPNPNIPSLPPPVN